MMDISESKPHENQGVEVVVYHKPQKKCKDHCGTALLKKNSKNVNEFDMKKARNEAIKLGMSGFFKYRKEKSMAAFAIELGAKPEKNKYKNYKELQQLRKNQREKRNERLNTLKESSNLSTLNHYKKKYRKKNEQKSKKNVDILDSYGKVKRK